MRPSYFHIEGCGLLGIKVIIFLCLSEGPQFDPLQLSFLFRKCFLWTLSYGFACTVNETLKWLTQLPTLMQSHSVGDSVASRC